MKINIETIFYFTALFTYALGLILCLASIWLPRTVTSAAYLITLLGFTAHTLSLVTRGISGGRLPVANLYEFLLLFAWGTVLIFILLKGRYLVHSLGVPVLLIVLLLMAYAGNLNKEVQPLMPALQSYWLKLHVAVAILAYGSFAISFGAGLLLLFKSRSQSLEANNPREMSLEALMNRAISFGFPFMTLVLITGAVWAEQVWGAWWSWDPKETWALVTWLIYAIYLHGRLNRNWRGQQSAWMVVVGFGAVLFTLFGVTWLLPGMHSYI